MKQTYTLFLYIAAILLMAFTACEGSNDFDSGYTPSLQKTGTSQATNHTSAYPTALEFGATAASKDITVTSNEEWTAKSSDMSWCTVMPDTGSNNGTVTVTVTENTTTNQRTATVTIKGSTSGNETTVTVTQAPTDDTPPTDENVLTVTANGVSFKMILVEAGTFQMGSNASDAYDDEKPVHSVTLTDDYYIGETEVTQALWYAVMGQKPTADGSPWNSTYGVGNNRPAYFIDRNDCLAFITKLNQLTGKTFRMPTEAEWEFAARGGNKSKGYKYSGSNTIGDVAWYTVNSKDKGTSSSDFGVHDVATKQANELGIYDMSGNVWEWCSDWYGPYSSNSQTNPTGPSYSDFRLIRGGGWDTEAAGCRVTLRYNWVDSRDCDLGLRLVLQ